MLTTLSLDDARSEIEESKREVERELGRPARIFCYPFGYHSPREVELVTRERLSRRRDVRVRRKHRRPSRTTSCGARSSSAPIRCGCSARGSPARPTHRPPAAARGASSTSRREPAAARARDARRGGRRADLRGHARRRPARALRDRGRGARTGRGARERLRRAWTCRSTTFATSCAIRTPTTTLAAVRELRSLARRLAPDVVQINSSKAGVLARLALRRPRRAHGVHRARLGVLGPHRRRRALLYTAGERAVAPLTDAIVCVSSHDLQLARERGISPRERPARHPQRRRRARSAAAAAPAGQPPRARLHCAPRAAQGPDHAAGRARPAGLRGLGAARVRRRPRPRGRSSGIATRSAWAIA